MGLATYLEVYLQDGEAEYNSHNRRDGVQHGILTIGSGQVCQKNGKDARRIYSATFHNDDQNGLIHSKSV